MKRMYPYKKRYKKFYTNEWGYRIPKYDKQPIDNEWQFYKGYEGKPYNPYVSDDDLAKRGYHPPDALVNVDKPIIPSSGGGAAKNLYIADRESVVDAIGGKKNRRRLTIKVNPAENAKRLKGKKIREREDISIDQQRIIDKRKQQLMEAAATKKIDKHIRRKFVKQNIQLIEMRNTIENALVELPSRTEKRTFEIVNSTFADRLDSFKADIKKDIDLVSNSNSAVSEEFRTFMTDTVNKLNWLNDERKKYDGKVTAKFNDIETVQKQLTSLHNSENAKNKQAIKDLMKLQDDNYKKMNGIIDEGLAKERKDREEKIKELKDGLKKYSDSLKTRTLTDSERDEIETMINNFEKKLDIEEKINSQIYAEDSKFNKMRKEDVTEFSRMIEPINKKMNDVAYSVNRYDKMFGEGGKLDQLSKEVESLKPVIDEYRRQMTLGDRVGDKERLDALENSFYNLREITANIIGHKGTPEEMNRFAQQFNGLLFQMSVDIPRLENNIKYLTVLDDYMMKSLKTDFYNERYKSELNEKELRDKLAFALGEIDSLNGTLGNIQKQKDGQDLVFSNHAKELSALNDELISLRKMVGNQSNDIYLNQSKLMELSDDMATLRNGLNSTQMEEEGLEFMLSKLSQNVKEIKEDINVGKKIFSNMFNRKYNEMNREQPTGMIEGVNRASQIEAPPVRPMIEGGKDYANWFFMNPKEFAKHAKANPFYVPQGELRSGETKEQYIDRVVEGWAKMHSDKEEVKEQVVVPKDLSKTKIKVGSKDKKVAKLKTVDDRNAAHIDGKAYPSGFKQYEREKKKVAEAKKKRDEEKIDFNDMPPSTRFADMPPSTVDGAAFSNSGTTVTEESPYIDEGIVPNIYKMNVEGQITEDEWNKFDVPYTDWRKKTIETDNVVIIEREQYRDRIRRGLPADMKFWGYYIDDDGERHEKWVYYYIDGKKNIKIKPFVKGERVENFDFEKQKRDIDMQKRGNRSDTRATDANVIDVDVADFIDVDGSSTTNDSTTIESSSTIDVDSMSGFENVDMYSEMPTSTEEARVTYSKYLRPVRRHKKESDEKFEKRAIRENKSVGTVPIERATDVKFDAGKSTSFNFGQYQKQFDTKGYDTNDGFIDDDTVVENDSTFYEQIDKNEGFGTLSFVELAAMQKAHSEATKKETAAALEKDPKLREKYENADKKRSRKKK